MLRKTLLLAGLIVASGMVLVPARSASPKECLGGKPNILGTRGADVIHVWFDEDNIDVTVNGRFRQFWNYPPVIFADKGNDRITIDSAGGGAALVCAGEGNDTITGNRMSRVHAGAGYDKVTQHLMCKMAPQVFAAEEVRSSYNLNDETGPGMCA